VRDPCFKPTDRALGELLNKKRESMFEESGIVLKSFFPYKNKVSLLTRSSGKVNLIVSPRKSMFVFSPGMLISGFFEKRGKSIFAKKIVPSFSPVWQHESHLYWGHHMLEICYHFVQLDQPCVEVFYLIKRSLMLEEKAFLFKPHLRLIRKVCLVNLLISIGFYPGRELLVMSGLFEKIVKLFLDSSNQQKVRSLHLLLKEIRDPIIEKADKWIIACLHDYSGVKQFKTLSFFDRF